MEWSFEKLTSEDWERLIYKITGLEFSIDHDSRLQPAGCMNEFYKSYQSKSGEAACMKSKADVVHHFLRRWCEVNVEGHHL